MPGISYLLSIAQKGIYASQIALDVTGHNIANINTPGYTKQELTIESATAMRSGELLIGCGVDVKGIKENQDKFINSQLLMGKIDLGYNEARSQGLDFLQEVFNESSGCGISMGLTDFFKAIQDMANSPDSMVERTALIGKAKMLINDFQQTATRLQDSQESHDEKIVSHISEINNLAKAIGQLNSKISAAEASGQVASDLRNSRDMALQELATLIDINTIYDNRGMAVVIVAEGKPLVEGTYVSSLAAKPDATNNGFNDVVYVDRHGLEKDITDEISGGKIRGDLQMRDEYLSDAISKLDQLAYALVSEINAVHEAGFGLDNSSGRDFFQALASSDGAALLIKLDPLVEADPRTIAAAQAPDSPGDNRNALALAALEETPTMMGGTASFSKFYTSLVGEVGILAQSAQQSYEQQTGLVDQLEALKSGLLGVSLEEEMSNLIMYQQSYQAAARVLNVVGEIFDALLNLT